MSRIYFRDSGPVDTYQDTVGAMYAIVKGRACAADFNPQSGRADLLLTATQKLTDMSRQVDPKRLIGLGTPELTDIVRRNGRIRI